MSTSWTESTHTHTNQPAERIVNKCSVNLRTPTNHRCWSMVDLATCKGHTPHQPLQRPLRCFISTGLVLCFLEVLAVFVDRIISQMSLRRTVGTACLIMPASSFQQPAQHIACLQVCEVLLASWLLIVLGAQPHLSTATHTLALCSCRVPVHH